MKDKIRGIITGVAIGDALGMPVESLSPETIQKYFKWISEYEAPNKKTKCFHNLKKGQWTDDTQLTLAIGESIVENKGINYEDIAKRHVDVFLNGRRGWGRATRLGVQKLLDGYKWWASGDKQAAGNAPPMKIAPIGILYGLNIINKIQMISICTNISQMTHCDPRAIIAATIQAYLIGFCVKYNYFDDHEIYKLSHELEGDILCDDSISRMFIFPNIKKMTDGDIREYYGAGPFVNESLPFTYSMIIKYKDDPEECLEHIINQGGDSDTNASMAGAILGALHGYSKFPLKWKNGLENKRRLLKLADNLLKLEEK